MVFSNSGPIFGIDMTEIAFISNPLSVLIVQHIALYLKGSICMNIGEIESFSMASVVPQLKLKEHLFTYDCTQA